MPKRMVHSPRDHRLLAALIANAILLGALCVVLAPHAGAQTAGLLGDAQSGRVNRDMVVMPAQLSPNTWGCYLLDKDHRTLAVYQYSPGDQMLRLMAGRDIQYDSQLKDFNTKPRPSDIKDLLERAAADGAKPPVSAKIKH